LNKKILIVIIVIVVISIAGTVVLNYASFTGGGISPSGTLMFQSDVADVIVTVLGPNETLRTGIVGENRQLSFTGLPDGSYTAIATKDGYIPSDMYGMSIRNGGMTTFPFSLSAIPSEQSLRLSTNPSAIIIKQGRSGIVTFDVTSPNDYAGTVSYDFQLPSGVTASFDSASVTVTAGGRASSILTLTASSTATKGVYPISVEMSYEQGGIAGVGLLLQVS
jgi:hypothetical protein